MTERLFLFGPRACGKTTVGRTISEVLNRTWDFIDIDYEFKVRFEDDFRERKAVDNTAYYDCCRTLLLEQLQRDRVIVAMNGGALVNEAAPSTAFLNLRDCRGKGPLVLLLPARRKATCRDILYNRERRRNYVAPKKVVFQQFDARIKRMRKNADRIIYGCDPKKSARQIIHAYGLNE